MRSAAAFAALTLVFLAGCTGLSAKPEPALAGTSWKLTGWSEAGVNPENFTITANFADGRVTGKAAVNNYFAAYTEGPEGKLTDERGGEHDDGGSARGDAGGKDVPQAARAGAELQPGGSGADAGGFGGPDGPGVRAGPLATGPWTGHGRYFIVGIR